MKVKIFLFIFLFSIQLFPQLISFPAQWKFKTGDNLSYKESNFNDEDWNTIPVPSLWENEGYENYDGFVWYRGN